MTRRPPSSRPKGGGRQRAKDPLPGLKNPFIAALKAHQPSPAKPVPQRQKDQADVFMGKLRLSPTAVAASTPSLFGTKKGEVKQIASHALAHALPTGPLKPTISAPPSAKQQAATIHQQAVWARNTVVPGKTGQKARKKLAASLTPGERAAKLSQQETSYAATKAAIDAQTFKPPRSDYGIGFNADKAATTAHIAGAIGKGILPTIHRDPFTHQPVLGAPPAAIGAAHIVGDIAHGAAVAAPAVGSSALHLQPIKGLIDNARAANAIRRGNILGPLGNVADAARYGLHQVEGLGRGLGEIGRGNVGEGSQLTLGSAAGVAQAGGFVPPGALGQVGSLPQNVVTGLGKVGVGTAAAIPGMAAHPLRSVDEAVGFVRGGGDAAIALGFLLQPGISSHERNRVYRQLGSGLWNDLMSKYGPDVTFKQAVKNGFNQPVIHLLDGLSVVAPAAKGASVLRYWKLPGVSLEDAVRLSRDPTLLGEIAPGVEAPRALRTATIRGKNIAPYEVPLPESRSPLWRGITRHVGDPFARGVEKVAGPRFPLSETKKGLRAQRQLSKQQVRRYAAEAHALMNRVQSYLGKEPEQGVRLFLSHQRPADMPEEVWLKALLKDTQNMLEEGLPAGERKLTPREQQLMRQVQSLRAGVDKLSQDRWGRRVQDVYHEQERLHGSLLLNEQHLKAARERLRVVEGPDEAGAYTDTIYKLRTDRGLLEDQLQKLAPDDPEIPLIRRALHDTTDKISALESARAHALETGDVAKGTRIQGARDDVRTLENRRDALKEQADAMSVDQSPVESEMRSNLIDHMNGLPGISDAEATHLTSLFDASARRWGDHFNRDPGEFYTDPTGFGLKEIRMIEEHADVPEGALAQVRFNLERSPARPKSKYPDLTPGPDTAAHNLRYVEGGDLHRPELGLQDNKKVYRTVRGVRIPVIGRMTPKEYIRRLQVLVPDRVERHRLAKWYEEVAPTIERFFGDNPDAEAILRGFAVSQANDSPSGGLQATLRVFDKIRAGEPLDPLEISVVVKQIEQAVRGQHVSRGLAAKLHDFADSIQGKDTRTWMGDDPRGGRPTANDVHAIRDLGYVDPKIVARLRNPESGAMFRKGLGEHEFQLDSGGSPGDHQYERMREQYEAIADEMNRTSFDGRNDWKPAEVQALGWSAIQRLHGTVPEDLGFAVAQNTRRINLEVTKGISGIGNDLTIEEAQLVVKQVAPHVRDIVEHMDGLHLDGGLETSVSAYEGTPNASIHFNVVGSPERAHDLVTALSEGFDQYDVWATRPSTSDGAKPTLVLVHPDLADPEKALALYRELYKADPKKFAGYAPGQHNGTPSIKLVMPGNTVFATTHDERLAELVPTVTQAVDASLGEGYAVDAHLTNTQIIGKEWKVKVKGVKGKQPRVARTGSEGALRDPHIAEARQRLTDAVDSIRAQRTPAGTTPPKALAQTRGQDLFGAVEFLDTPEGQRILHLSEQADVSTLLHELYGHNVREIARAYPEQWARVEDFIGKTLEEFDVADHEQFARWSERYFADGIAPTPELVPVFQHLKRSYRETYGAMNRIGSPPPPEVKALFDEMFGSYDDPTVFRVANMTISIPHDMRSAEQHAVFEFSSQQLAALRRRNDTRAYNRSIEKLQNDFSKQVEKADAAGGFEHLPEDDQAQMVATRSQLLVMQAEKTMAEVDRATGLRRRVDQIEAALASPTGDGYDGALAALGHLTDMRENILRSVFGDKYDSVFSNRVDLLADHLVDKGLIEPDFARGTAKYAPHMPLGGKEPRRVDRPASGLEGGVIGEVDQSLLGLHNKNNLYRWQNGDLSTDPKVIFDVWQNAQAFAFIKEMKDLMFQIGRKLGPNEPIPDNVYLVKRNGTPVPNVQKVASKIASTDEVQDALTALEARDPAKLEEVVTRYVDDTFVKSEDMQAALRAAAAESGDAGVAARLMLDNVRVVDRHIVEGLFRPLRGGTSTGSRAVDWANTVARWSLIYTNPAYIPVNFIGNNFFLLGQQGPMAVVNLVRASKMLLGDSELAIRVAGETGELPAMAAIARGRGVGAAVRQREERYLRAYTAIPDKLPRMAAWVYEARRMGYRSKEDMLRLIDAKPGTALARKRDLVSHRSTEVMVNFDRLSDWERQTVTKVLFIWPWIRGATAWPFYYAREFPVQTALAANLGQVSEDRRKAMMGNVRSAYRDLYPVSKHGQFVKEINVSAFSPTSTAADSLQALLDFGRINVPSEQGSRVMDFFNPLWQGITQNVTGMNDYGRPISHKDALFDAGINFLPFGGLVRQIIDPSKASKVYNRRDWKALIERRVGKIVPMEVDLNRLHAFQLQNQQLTTDQKVAKKVAYYHQQQVKLGYKDPLPNNVRKALRWQQTFEDLGDEQKKKIADSSTWHPPSPGAEPKLPAIDRAQDAYKIYKQVFPDFQMIPPRASWSDKDLQKYTDMLMYGNAKLRIDSEHAILGPLVEYRKTLAKVRRQQSGGG